MAETLTLGYIPAMSLTKITGVLVAGGFLVAGCASRDDDPGAEVSKNAELRDRLAVEGGKSSVRKVIDMSDDWWVEGAQNRVHGDTLLSLRDKHPDIFRRELERSRARGSALVLMEAAEAGAEFAQKPSIIFLEREPGSPAEGGLTIDLGIP
jgi:hypothetical protein